MTNKVESIDYPPDKAIVLHNFTCVYCGNEFEQETNTKEHVIGRRFVPRGKFDKSWNLIVRACWDCNNKKAKLENDISAITMQPDATGVYADNNQDLVEEAQRKGKKSFSNLTGRPVEKSKGNLNVTMPFKAGGVFKINLTAPPQIQDERIYQLAMMQMRAFFYLITYDQEKRTGGFWPGGFYPVNWAHRLDWGNSIQTAFMNNVIDWKIRWSGIAADLFFRSNIRKHPESDCWSSALEWNKNYRIIGLFGDPETVEKNIAALPKLQINSFPAGPGMKIYARIEEKLDDEEDIMFHWENE